MADTTEQQNDKKTVVAFIVGLLIGGLLVWAFSSPATPAPKTADETTEEATEETTEESSASEETTTSSSDTPAVTTLPVGEGSVNVGSPAAGTRVVLESATFPISEGWIGIRDYQDERLGMILGVVRFSESQGLVPKEIILQRPTRAGAQYAIVVFSENGDRAFNLANDVQIDKVFATFTAQ